MCALFEMTKLPQCAELIARLAHQTGSLQEYEDLYIVLRNLSRADLEVAVTQCNLLDIFNHMNLSNGYESFLTFILK